MILDCRCSSSYGGHLFRSFSLADNHVTSIDMASDNLDQVFTAYPVSKPEHYYHLMEKFVLRNIELEKLKIAPLQAEVDAMPGVDSEMVLPADLTGNTVVPKTRFDIIPWEYFDENYRYECPDGQTKCKLPKWRVNELQEIKALVKDSIRSGHIIRQNFFRNSVKNSCTNFFANFVKNCFKIPVQISLEIPLNIP